MKFGTRVLVTRGSNHHAMNLRVVPGKLIGARGNNVLVKLDFYDGPHDDLYWKEHGIWFGKSQVVPFAFPFFINRTW